MINQPMPRSCGNCACFAHMLADGTVLEAPKAGAEAQTVCRRNTPGGRYVTIEVPVFDAKTGAPVLRRAGGEQRTERKQVLQIGFPPAVANGVCFDGWRPLGTEPGENYKVANIERVLFPIIAELAAGRTQAAKKLADGMIADMLAADDLPPRGGKTS